MSKIITTLNNITLWKKKFPPLGTKNSMCPPNYTKNKKVGDLVDTPDPNGNNSDPKPKATKVKHSVNKYRETRMVQYIKR